MKRTSRKPSNLSESLHQRLNSYALAASAAGVSLLALAQPSEAKIIYTKTHQVIGSNDVYPLDLNHDGTIDFLIQELGTFSSSFCTSQWKGLFVKEALGNAVEGGLHGSWRWAAALKRGDPIGPFQVFVSNSGYRGEQMASVACHDMGCTSFGQWVNVNNRYLGLRFLIAKKTHYGWARLNVKVKVGGCSTITATLTGYAYETIPNKAIIAGKTHGGASLGALAAGSIALSSRRHKIRSK